MSKLYLILLAVLFCLSAGAQDKAFNHSDSITSFNSLVRIQPNGKLLVTETIRVYNGDGSTYISSSNADDDYHNDEIQRGIVRAFPVRYLDSNQLVHNTTFSVKEVLRDGNKEDYHTEDKANGILLYTGNKDLILPTGYYTYTITYETDHQLKFLKDFDELYWNATGNSWSFKIDSASCTFVLPQGATSLSNHCYTGAQGSVAEDCDYSVRREGDAVLVIFRATKGFQPDQGLTVAGSWPKGFVEPPSAISKAWNMLMDNKAMFLLPIAALFSLIFCYFFWNKYGRDPEAGVIYPRFEPPAGFSPAALGYIANQQFDYKLTVATIVDAAVRNKVKIDVEREGLIFKHNEYVFSKPDKTARLPLSTYEEFNAGIERMIGKRVEKGQYNADLATLNGTISTYCDTNYKTKDSFVKRGTSGYFALNKSYMVIPRLVCIAAAIWAFTSGLVPALQAKGYIQGLWFIGGVILCIVVLRIFNRIIPAYNAAGRKLADEIEGFRMFLRTADEQRFDTMAPPTKSLTLYENYLPFAIALGCEIEWGNKFRAIIEAAAIGGQMQTHSFIGSMNAGGSNSFSSSFTSSFSGAISSASTPPSSSSSGSGGGGSSGGGGGGGGGGGW